MQFSFTNSIGLFGRKSEKVNLLLPVVFLGIAVVEILMHLNFDIPVQREIWRGLAATVLFNTTHVGMTYSGWIAMPEVRSWLKSSRNFWSISAWIATFLSLFFFFFGAVLDVLPIPRDLAFSFLDILLIWHGLGQSKGLSLLYNRKLVKSGLLSASEMNRLQRCENIERLAVFGLMISYSVVHFATNVESVVPPHIGNWVRDISPFIHGPLVLAIIASFFGTPQIARTNKILHGVRYGFWIIGPFSYMAGIGLLAMHGIEYAIVNINMAEKSKMSPQVWWSWKKATIAMCTFFFMISALMPGGFGDLAVMQFAWLKIPCAIAAGFISASTSMHAFFDRAYFRYVGAEKNGAQAEQLLVNDRLAS